MRRAREGGSVRHGISAIIAFCIIRQKPVIRAQVRHRAPTESDVTRQNRLQYQQFLRRKEQLSQKPYLIKHLSTDNSKELHQPLHALSIPNGVPVHAGTWEDGRPHYEIPKRPQQLAAATVGSANPSLVPATQSGSGAQAFGTGTAIEDNLVNAIFAQSKAGALNPSAAAQLPQTVSSAAAQSVPTAPNPLEALLANSASLDQFTKIAQNILNFGGAEGAKGGLLETMTNALRGARLPLPSASFSEDGKSKPQPTIMETILSQAASALNQSIKEKDDKEKQFRMTKDREDSLKLLENLPEEERKLLHTAITSGDLDAESLGPALKSLVKDDTKEESKKEKESRLLEWIRENRPMSKHTEVVGTVDKLPYYGKYCGSFAEQLGATKRFKPSGAVWVVDDKRFIISKFSFQPGSLLSENVTFWLGPLNQTENVLADMFPSSNGFYIAPQPIDVSTFAADQLPPMEAKARSGSAITNLLMNGLNPIQPVMEKAKKFDSLRVRRDAVTPPEVEEEVTTTGDGQKQVELLVRDGVVQLNGNGSRDLQSLLHDDMESMGSSDTPFNTIGPSAYTIRQPEDDKINYSYAQPLEWYAGFQPLLLTLPDGIVAKSVHWISLRDHKRHETIASVLLPNGPAFQIPGTVQLRGFSPNGLFNISSGPIRVIDIKTIEISDFVLRTNAKAVWFMIGKDILPNANGHIVPLYDRELKLFDCDSLRDYNGETVHLRLPGNLDIKDVFWFSVYSIVDSVSYSHIYLPFNDMQLPPDLNGVPTPSCKYTP
ncbi:DM13 domain-containing protein [Trichostrongylus colubriformis]|uniref:DM13 domain-containing protein n=1 Tax=Trichostrongylus colubriformis TaxID=6319 RepID=A0AAN8IND9_TRICO